MTHKEWLKYNKACKNLIVVFLKKYYPDESIETVYFVGNEGYTGVFECCDRYYDIDFIQQCLRLEVSFEDMESYQEHVLQCMLQGKEEGINFRTWVKYPEMRKTPEEQPFTAEERLKRLLKKCIPALEGITQYESLLAEIKNH